MAEVSLVNLPLDECHSTLQAVRQQAFTWANVDPDLCRQMASLGLNELTHWPMENASVILNWVIFKQISWIDL